MTNIHTRRVRYERRIANLHLTVTLFDFIASGLALAMMVVCLAALLHWHHWRHFQSGAWAFLGFSLGVLFAVIYGTHQRWLQRRASEGSIIKLDDRFQQICNAAALGYNFHVNLEYLAKIPGPVTIDGDLQVDLRGMQI